MTAGFVKNLYISLHSDYPGSSFNYEIDYPGYKRQLGIFMWSIDPGDLIIYWKNITQVSFVKTEKYVGMVTYAGIEYNNKCIPLELTNSLSLCGVTPRFDINSIKIDSLIFA